MKRSQQCPKCLGQRLWVIDPFRVPSDTASGAELAVAHQQQPGSGFLALARVEPRGRFELWACDRCGYSELWAEGLDELRHDPEHGVRLVDTTVKREGPFR